MTHTLLVISNAAAWACVREWHLSCCLRRLRCAGFSTLHTFRALEQQLDCSDVKIWIHARKNDIGLSEPAPQGRWKQTLHSYCGNPACHDDDLNNYVHRLIYLVWRLLDWWHSFNTSTPKICSSRGNGLAFLFKTHLPWLPWITVLAKLPPIIHAM